MPFLKDEAKILFFLEILVALLKFTKLIGR